MADQTSFIVSEILCYIQNTINNVTHDFIIKTVADFYNSKDIHEAKKLLFDKCEMTTLRFKSFTIDSSKNDCRDIINKLNEVGVNCPIFVAKTVSRLPVCTSGAYDLVKVSNNLSDVLQMKETITNSATTITALQSDLQCVLEKCELIDTLMEQINSIKLAIEHSVPNDTVSHDDNSTEASTIVVTSPNVSTDDVRSPHDDTLTDNTTLTNSNTDPAEAIADGDTAAEPPPVLRLTDRPTPVNEHAPVLKLRLNHEHRPPHVTESFPVLRLNDRPPHITESPPVLRLNDRPPHTNAWLSEGGFQIKQHKDRVFVNSARQKPCPTLKAVKVLQRGPNTHHNKGYQRNNEQCDVFVSRLDPMTSVRDVTLNLRSKYNRDFKVEQLRTKYDAYASFKITAPSSVKSKLLNSANWDDANILIRPFVGRSYTRDQRGFYQ